MYQGLTLSLYSLTQLIEQSGKSVDPALVKKNEKALALLPAPMPAQNDVTAITDVTAQAAIAKAEPFTEADVFRALKKFKTVKKPSPSDYEEFAKLYAKAVELNPLLALSAVKKIDG